MLTRWVYDVRNEPCNTKNLLTPLNGGVYNAVSGTLIVSVD